MSLKCSYDVIMSGGPLGERRHESCVAYIKRDVVGPRALGKKQVSLRHKRTKATHRT